MNNVGTVLICVAIAIVAFMMLSIICGIDDCLRATKNKLIEETSKIKYERIEILDNHTKHIREMIKEDIVTEIDIFIGQKTLEKEKIVMLNLDKDIERIANNVYEGYVDFLSKSDDLVCSADHIRREIINYTTILLSTKAVEFNESFN